MAEVKINATPTADRVFVQVDESSSTSAGGIVLTKKEEDVVTGEILKVGPGRVVETGRMEPVDLKVGQRVLFNKYAGTKVKVDGQEILVLKEDDVLGIFE